MLAAAATVPQSPFVRAVDVDGVASVVVVVQLPAQESTPISFDARAEGPRSMQWHWLEPATLVFYEALVSVQPNTPRCVAPCLLPACTCATSLD